MVGVLATAWKPEDTQLISQMLARLPAVWQGSPRFYGARRAPARADLCRASRQGRCRSSVVEHSLGKIMVYRFIH